MYSDTLSSTSCGIETIQAASCVDRACLSHLQLSDNACSNSSNITVTVFATNILGNGPLSKPVFVEISKSINYLLFSNALIKNSQYY